MLNSLDIVRLYHMAVNDGIRQPAPPPLQQNASQFFLLVRGGLIATLGIFTLLSNFFLLQSIYVSSPRFVDAEMIRSYDQHFFETKTLLPPHGMVGYISDKDPGDAITAPFGLAMYYLTQYTLAPVIVTATTQPEFIVGNFENENLIPGVAADYHLTLVKNFGNGVVLLQHQ